MLGVHFAGGAPKCLLLQQGSPHDWADIYHAHGSGGSKWLQPEAIAQYGLQYQPNDYSLILLV